jgi:hypothetical protein
MSDHLDEPTASAIAQGERNAHAIQLIKHHCAHARVEHSKLHGWSMVEDMTGLPISVREMRCEHAPAPTSVGYDLLTSAIGFYEQNCIGCPYREVQGLPNLKTTADKVLGERRRQRENEERQAQNAEDERRVRAATRAERVASDPPGTREIVSLLDGIDADTVDGRAEELVDLCRLHPELCTPAAGDVLLEVAVTHPRDPLFAALGHLARAGTLDRDRLLEAAVQGLSQLPMNHAAALVVELSEGLSPGQLRPALRSIARLAVPLLDFGPRPEPDLSPLRVAAAHDLPALLDELQVMIGAQEPQRRRVGAGAAARLMEFEPSVASVLIRPLIDALSLPESLSPYMGSPRGELQDGLRSALLADAKGTVAIFEQRAGTVSEEVRTALFHVLDAVIRRGWRDEAIPTKAAEQVIDAAFRRLSGDWGDKAAGEAARMIELTAHWQPGLMSLRVDQLFGALMTYTATPVEPSSALALPPSSLPPALQALEAMNRRSSRAAIIRNLREAIGRLVPHAPDSVARNVLSIIEAPEPSSEDALELRDEAVRLLGDIGRRADMLKDMLPVLWTALVHSDQRVRAHAVEAWRKIAAAHGGALPGDLAELLPVLLEDQYVIVHRAGIRAVREGLPVSDATLGRIVMSLFGWANTYASRDPQLLDEILHALWKLSSRLPDRSGDALREHCLQFAAHLDTYDKERFVEWAGRGSERLTSYPLRLLEVLADARDLAGQRDDDLLRRLRSLSSERLASLSDRIMDTARAHLPGDTWQAQRFVEVLQRAGCWSEALELSEEILAAIPETTEEAIQRDGARSLTELARAEIALREGRNIDTDTALKAAIDANQRQRDAFAKQRYPWDEA